MALLDDRDFSDVPSIGEYYRGKSIFITGGSGFMGKVLVEKLLYSCPELDRIYLLMRSKKGVKPEDRFNQLYSSSCFERLRGEKPTIFKSKVSFIAGDTMQPGLGLSPEDRALIVNRVNIIFHVAASVRFDDPLTYAAKINIGGTKEVVDLAKQVRNLSCLLHVSTVYGNTNREIIEEVIYPPHADWRDTLDICDKTDAHSLRVLTAKYLGEIPNTYTFTKQLAEHVVYETKGQLPVVIFRPSIVVSSFAEPAPGWLDNFNGPVGLMVASGKGILRIVYSEPIVKSDYIPVDISIKSMIAAAWVRGTKEFSPTDDVLFINCCIGEMNPISLEALTKMAVEVYPAIPLDNMLWSTGGVHTNCKYNHYIQVILFHLLPAIFVDAILRMTGRKTFLFKLQRRIYTANLALEYFLTRQWKFVNKNMLTVQSKIKAEDQDSFSFDLLADKKEYLFNSLRGGRKYLLHEKDEDIPKAKVHFKRIHLLDRFVKITFYAFLIWRFVCSSFFQNFLTNIVDVVLD